MDKTTATARLTGAEPGVSIKVTSASSQLRILDTLRTEDGRTIELHRTTNGLQLVDLRGGAFMALVACVAPIGTFKGRVRKADGRIVAEVSPDDGVTWTTMLVLPGRA